MIYAIPYILLYTFYLFLYKKSIYYRGHFSLQSVKNLENIAIITYLLFFGFRGYIFTDCFQYHQFYETIDDYSFTSFETLFEPGYVLCNIVLHSINENPFFFQFVWTTIDLYLICKILRRETGDYFLLAFAFLIPFFEGVQMNLFRNIKAILIFFWALKYVRTNSFVKYSLSILLASTFHLTALFYWPLYFILNRKLKYLMFVISITTIGLYFIGLNSLLDDMTAISIIIGGKFERITTAYIDSAVNTGFTFGFLYRSFLLCFLLFLYKKLASKNLIMLNLGILYICCSMTFNDILVLRDRFTALFTLSMTCILPYIPNAINLRFYKIGFVVINMLCTYAYTYVQNSTIAAKYENVLFGVSDRDKAENRIFESLE